jgi:hypothetical protein
MFLNSLKDTLQISLFSWMEEMIILGKRNTNPNDNLFSLLLSYLSETYNKWET